MGEEKELKVSWRGAEEKWESGDFPLAHSVIWPYNLNGNREDLAMASLPVKTVDDKGRLTLGKEFAHKQFFIDRKDGNVIQIIPAETVPAREAWLFKDPEALASVMRGLEQVRSGETAEAPDLAADIALFEDSEGD